MSSSLRAPRRAPTPPAVDRARSPESIARAAFRARAKAATAAGVAFALAAPRPLQASIFHGETLDTIADVISWIVLIVVPVVLITAFWLVHILPEKIAHKRGHPQTKAIQCLCLLSLVFAGLLWPLAWLWAYSKPVFYKMAYGTDVDESLKHPDPPASGSGAEEASEPEKGAS